MPRARYVRWSHRIQRSLGSQYGSRQADARYLRHDARTSVSVHVFLSLGDAFSPCRATARVHRPGAFRERARHNARFVLGPGSMHPSTLQRKTYGSRVDQVHGTIDRTFSRTVARRDWRKNAEIFIPKSLTEREIKPLAHRYDDRYVCTYIATLCVFCFGLSSVLTS